MPWESIGSVDTGEIPDDEAWILFCLGLAKNYVQFVCGLPPDESKLEVMWSEHELVDYPSLGVWYDIEEPWNISLLPKMRWTPLTSMFPGLI